MRNHVALYGSVKMLRGYCRYCRDEALIVGGKYTCCGIELDGKGKKYKRMATSNYRRKKPPLSEQRRILKAQENRCLYCDYPFGTYYFRNGKILKMKLHWDHLVPYVHSAQHKLNFVAACNVCNGIKSSKMFDTVEEVYYYVKYRREKKGIEYLSEEKSEV